MTLQCKRQPSSVPPNLFKTACANFHKLFSAFSLKKIGETPYMLYPHGKMYSKFEQLFLFPRKHWKSLHHLENPALVQFHLKICCLNCPK